MKATSFDGLKQDIFHVIFGIGNLETRKDTTFLEHSRRIKSSTPGF